MRFSPGPSFQFSRRHGLAALCGALIAPRALADAQTPPPVTDASLTSNFITRIAIEVSLGARNADFVIDTGAEVTSIADTLARELSLSAGPDVIVHGIAAARRTATVTIPRLALLDQAFDRLSTPVFQRDALGAEGLLGLDVLSRFRLELDLRNRRASLSPSGDGLLYDGARIPPPGRIRPGKGARRTATGQLLLSSVRIGDQVVEAFIDSGAQHSIGNSRLALMAGPAEEVVPLFSVFGQSLTAQKRTVPDIRIASRRFHAVPLLFADLHVFNVLAIEDRPALLVGADLLTRFSRITLDYGAGRIGLG